MVTLLEEMMARERTGSRSTTHEIASAMLPLGASSVGARMGGIYLLDDDGNALELIAQVRYREEGLDRFRLVSMATPIPLTHCVREAKPLFLLSHDEFERYEAGFLTRHPYVDQALTFLPLLARGRCIGAMLLGAELPWQLGESERALLLAFAAHAALALDGAKRSDEANVRHNLALVGDRFERLHAFTGALARAITTDEVSQVVVDAAIAASGARSTGLWLLDDDQRSVTLVRKVGTQGPTPENFARVPLDLPSRLPILDAVQSGAPVWLESCRQIELRYPAAFAAFADGADSALACVPLHAQDRCIGAIAFKFDNSRQFVEHERAFYQMITWYASQALERARLLEAEQRARTAAETLYKEARAADRLKDEFLAMLSHELRNPLVPIVAAVDLMGLADSEQFTRERGLIERNARHLVRLVDDLLDVSRITRGKISLSKEHCELSDLLRDAIDIALPLVEERKHKLQIACLARGLPVFVDRVRIAQAIANLLMNAAKYTDRGGTITVTAEAVAQNVLVRVNDTGTGIAPENIDRIFDIFVQAPDAPLARQGGLGIGLTIVKRLVELHGGSVSVTSAGHGQGSEFVITLPLSMTDAPHAITPPSTKRASSGERRALVVDDNEDAASAIAELMKAVGFAAEIAHDGPAALELASQVRPDVVLLDLGMPKMDGYEVARRLRSSHPALHIIAVTGFGQQSDLTRTREAGFDEHLVKPLTLERLRRLAADLFPSH